MRKSKRNYSYTGTPVPSSSAAAATLAADTSHSKLASLLDYEQPLYENLTDSIQICEEILPASGETNASLIKFNNPDSDTNSSGNNNSGKRNPVRLSNKERMSIHRSDSGISNSSYEYLPQITPRVHPHSQSKTKRYHLTAPVYINVPYVSNNTSNTLHSYTTSRQPKDNDSNEVCIYLHNSIYNCCILVAVVPEVQAG